MKKGFTLIEVLVYIAVLVIILVAVYSLFLWAVNSYTKTRALRETLDSARRATELITYEIKEAKSILNAGPGVLSLQEPGGTIVDFYLCGLTLQSLCLKRGSEDPAFLTSNKVEITDLNFIQISTSSIQVSLSVNYQNPASRPEYQALITATSTTSLRPH